MRPEQTVSLVPTALYDGIVIVAVDGEKPRHHGLG